MDNFEGFSEKKGLSISLPEGFYRDLLPLINDLEELKIILYFFWRLGHLEGAIRFINHKDLMKDENLSKIINANPETSYQKIKQAIKKTVDHGVILEVKIEKENEDESVLFLNSPKGRSAVKAIQEGKWNPKDDEDIPFGTLEEPENIFQLYESNISVLTPMIAETLKEAEDTYPLHWIKDAIQIAVERNKRSWRYIEAILKRWQLEGRDVKKEKSNNQRDSEKDRRRYIEGEFSDFIEH